MDHWSADRRDDIMWSIHRRSVASERLLKVNGNVKHEDLWEIMSVHPVFNEVTVYGTLMSAADGYLETKLPHKRYGFVDGKGGDIEGVEDGNEDEEWILCKRCARQYHESLNVEGECSHIGSWHSQFSDCNKLSCAVGLGVTDIGKQHWGCCYAVEYSSKCPQSGKHEPMPKITNLGLIGYEKGSDTKKGWNKNGVQMESSSSDKSSDGDSDSDSESESSSESSSDS